MCQTSQTERREFTAARRQAARWHDDDDDKQMAIDQDVEQNGSERDQEGKGRTNNDDVIS